MVEADPGLLVPDELRVLVRAFEHLQTSLHRLPHRVKEYLRQKFGQCDPNFGSHQLVGRHLAEDVSCAFTDQSILRAAEDVDQTDDATWEQFNEM